ncbi:sporulation protein [Endozoicomonas arenosclerae]|uniref:sporulation protein n=1 Tax=Endozoicomonas arenosclerae TaxID=1633495 RepID=UPI00078576CD|nr:sporulation protein [Endozoicomonas arenosclerae]
MFDKLKASLGFGAAKVDTVLDNIALTQGDELTGTIYVKGGDVEQTIAAISLSFNTEVKEESDSGVSYQTFPLGEMVLTDSFNIQPGEEQQIPFSWPLHAETPVTVLNTQNNQSRFWVETQLDIEFAVDPSDRDFIEIHPLPVVAGVIHAIEQSGFELVKSDVEKGFLQGSNFSSQSGCYQEIEFLKQGFLGSKEIELSFVLENEQVHCLGEVDKSLSLRDDQYFSFTLPMDASDTDIHEAVEPMLTV